MLTCMVGGATETVIATVVGLPLTGAPETASVAVSVTLIVYEPLTTFGVFATIFIDVFVPAASVPVVAESERKDGVPLSVVALQFNVPPPEFPITTGCEMTPYVP